MYNRDRMLKGDDKNGVSDNYYNGAVYNAADKDLMWGFGLYQDRKHLRFIRVQENINIPWHARLRIMSLLAVWYVRTSFSAYKGLEFEGFTHRTVNHSEYYVDLVTGVHMQATEHACVDVKSCSKRALRNRELLQSLKMHGFS